MIRSSIITPMRWYSDMFEQERFSKDCELCPFELITDKTRLLPFQIIRPVSVYPIKKFWIRPACENYYSPKLNTNDALFILDSGNWLKTRFTITNGHAKGGSGTSGTLQYNSVLTPGKKYSVKIIVSEIYKVSGGAFSAEPVEGTNSLGSIFTPDTYTYTFTATATYFKLTFSSSSASNYIIVDEISINEVTDFDESLGDIEIPKSTLYLCNAGDVDYITYCGPSLDNQLPCGNYYSIIETIDGVLYFSEVFTVKDFIPSQSPYVLLEWNNSCDLSDVLFVGQACDYKNRLYIDGPVSKPEYPFKEEGEEDGNNTLNITFQKWEKQRVLTVPKAPEFIVDALTAIRLHDTIEYTYPIRKKQYKVGDANEVEKAEITLSPVFDDCATNVDIKMTVKNKIVKTKCCESITICECKGCTIKIPQIDELNIDYQYALMIFATDLVDLGLYQLIDDVWTKVEGKAGVIICDDSKDNELTDENSGYWEYQPTHPNAVGGYVFVPGFTYFEPSGAYWDIKGAIPTFCYGYVEFTTDGGSTWTPSPTIFSSSEIAAGLLIQISPEPCCGNFQARIKAYDILGCLYGTTGELENSSKTSDCC